MFCTDTHFEMFPGVSLQTPNLHLFILADSSFSILFPQSLPLLASSKQPSWVIVINITKQLTYFWGLLGAPKYVYGVKGCKFFFSVREGPQFFHIARNFHRLLLSGIKWLVPYSPLCMTLWFLMKHTTEISLMSNINRGSFLTVILFTPKNLFSVDVK